MTRDDGRQVIQLLKSEGKYEQFLKSVSFVCHKCGSFVIKTPALLRPLEQLLEDFEGNEEDIDQALYDALWNMRNDLLKPVMLSDEEWKKYFTHGLKEYRFAYDDKGDLITDEDAGNPLAYVSDEVVIELDDQCECRKILNRLKEDNL